MAFARASLILANHFKPLIAALYFYPKLGDNNQASKKKDYYMYSMVRVLPMDKKNEFNEQSIQDVQNSFFLEDVPNRKTPGKYYFKTSGLKANLKETLVLFQYDNHIIASATLNDTTKFDKPEGDFKGALFFEPNSIKTFKPKTNDELGKIFGKNIKFSQIKHDLDAKYADDFLESLVNIKTAF